MADDLVVVYETPAPMVARIVCSLLESDGIPFVREPEFPGPMSHLDTAVYPVRVSVPGAYARRASDLIGEFENAEIVDPEFAEERAPDVPTATPDDADTILRLMQRG